MEIDPTRAHARALFLLSLMSVMVGCGGPDTDGSGGGSAGAPYDSIGGGFSTDTGGQPSGTGAYGGYAVGGTTGTGAYGGWGGEPSNTGGFWTGTGAVGGYGGDGAGGLVGTGAYGGYDGVGGLIAGTGAAGGEHGYQQSYAVCQSDLDDCHARVDAICDALGSVECEKRHAKCESTYVQCFDDWQAACTTSIISCFQDADACYESDEPYGTCDDMLRQCNHISARCEESLPDYPSP